MMYSKSGYKTPDLSYIPENKRKIEEKEIYMVLTYKITGGGRLGTDLTTLLLSCLGRNTCWWKAPSRRWATLPTRSWTMAHCSAGGSTPWGSSGNLVCFMFSRQVSALASSKKDAGSLWEQWTFSLTYVVFWSIFSWGMSDRILLLHYSLSALKILVSLFNLTCILTGKVYVWLHITLKYTNILVEFKFHHLYTWMVFTYHFLLPMWI